jgi:aminopeptidase
MEDKRIKKLAELMVNYSIGVKPDQKIVIEGSTAAAPLLKELYVQVLKAGAYPFMVTSIPSQQALFFKYASEKQLKFIHEPVKYIIEKYDARIAIMAEENTQALNSVDPSKISIARLAQKDLSKVFFERAAKKELAWTVGLFPTNAYAQDAGMELSEYEDFVYQACMPDIDDPISYWKKVSAKQQRIVDWLRGKKSIHVIGNETNLRLSIEGRSFINCDCHENVPDGEIFTGPVENSVEGFVYFSYPAIHGGRKVSGIRLWFEKGKVVKATADLNEGYLLKTIDTDDGARYVGEFAIGTNKGIKDFTGQILFDEKIGGSFHMALGLGFPETGSKNSSAIHWDMICDLRSNGEIWVDDILIYKNGDFVIDF